MGRDMQRNHAALHNIHRARGSMLVYAFPDAFDCSKEAAHPLSLRPVSLLRLGNLYGGRGCAK
jgi:hypothetical protein